MSLYPCDSKTFEYGEKNNQIHEFFEKKRDWSKIKDEILSKYLDSYLKTIHRRGSPITIVDSFSGPGVFGDQSDGSPLMLCKLAEENKGRSSGIEINCIFSDVHPAHREALEWHIKKYISNGIAEKPYSDFTESLSKALEKGKKSTIFFYLDPYGIKDLEFDIVKQIYERGSEQSTEVLINFNFKTFMRLSGNWTHCDSAEEIAQKVKKSKIEKINQIMGGDYWLKIITDPKIDKIQREDLIIEAYKKLVRKYFYFTLSIPVKEIDESETDIPRDLLAKYHLIFGTRHPRAVVYMNDVANKALEPYMDQFKEGFLFPCIPKRYEPASVDEIKKAILEVIASKQQMTRQGIKEAVMPRFFMHYRSKDYHAFVYDLIKEKHIFPDPKQIKRKDKISDEVQLSLQPWG